MRTRCLIPVFGPLLVLIGVDSALAQTDLIPIAQSQPQLQPIQPASLSTPVGNSPLPLGGQPIPRVWTGLVPLPPTGSPPPPGYDRPGLGQGRQPMQGFQPVPPPQPMPMVEMPMLQPAPQPMPMPMMPKVTNVLASSTPMPNTAVPVTRSNPSLVIETTGPESTGIGQQFSYEIRVTNTSNSPVFQVKVEEELPPGTKYMGGDPLGEIVGDRIVWEIGVLEPSAEKKVRVDVRPTVEGELRTRATVTCSTNTGLRTKVTRPKISASVTGPTNASAGDAIVFQISLTNMGTGVANRIALRATLSDGLQHPQGSIIEAELAGIPPGETKSVSLRAIAMKSGIQHCDLAVSSEGGAESTSKAVVQVVEPSLQIKQIGASRCLVNAEPTYTIEISNPGSSPTAPVHVMTTVPEGMSFVSASDGGNFDSARRLITWDFTGQTAGTSKTLTFKARASTAGEWILKSMASAGPRLDSKAETQVKIEGIPALFFEVIDLADPVPLDKETTYEIRVVNQGTCACTNIQISAQMSEGMQALSVTGPVGHKVLGQTLTFEPYAKLATKADAVFRVKVRGVQAGDLRFKVLLSCNEIRQPITKEESTRFYKE